MPLSRQNPQRLIECQDLPADLFGERQCLIAQCRRDASGQFLALGVDRLNRAILGQRDQASDGQHDAGGCENVFVRLHCPGAGVWRDWTRPSRVSVRARYLLTPTGLRYNLVTQPAAIRPRLLSGQTGGRRSHRWVANADIIDFTGQFAFLAIGYTG